MTEARPFTIEKRKVWEAFQHVNANQGAAGVDGQTLGALGNGLVRTFTSFGTECPQAATCHRRYAG